MRATRLLVLTAVACAGLVALPCAAQTTLSYTTPERPIPDLNAAGIAVDLEALGLGDVVDVDLRFDTQGLCDGIAGNVNAAITHTYVGDLEISLVSPSGTTALLIDNRGAGRNNICDLLLDDDSGGPSISTISGAGTDPVAGTYTPDAPLAVFDGEPASGTWTLRVADLATGDTGVLRRFSLIITTTPVQPIVVDVLDDPFPGGCAPGSCSLREAVLLANSHPGFDRIVLPAATVSLTRAGVDDSNASGDLDITGDLEIVGQGMAQTRITQSATDRVFHVLGSGTDLTLRNLWVSGGNGVSEGGALQALNNARLTLDHARFSGNSAFDRGGAINHTGGGDIGRPRVAITDSEFSGNSVAGGVKCLGGAMASFSSGFDANFMRIERTNFSANTATHGGGALLLDGVQSVSGNTVVIRDSSFVANEAALGNGGAIASNSSGYGFGLVFLDVAGTVFDENVAGDPANGLGGAIATSSTLNLVDSTLVNNSARTGGAIDAGQVNLIRGSTLCGNTAVVSGGAARAPTITLIERSTFCDNAVSTSDTAQFGGGALAVTSAGASVTIRRSTFDNNNAVRGGAITQQGGDLLLHANTFVAPTTIAPGTLGSLLRYVAGSSGDTQNFNSNIFIGQCNWGNSANVVEAALNNLEASGNTCKLTAATLSSSNQVAISGSSINLAALADNGGPTRTRLPVTPSVAIGAGANFGCITLDQRGYLVTDGACDAGAVEAGAAPPPETFFANGFE